jgi:LysM repeat protein
MSLYIVVLLVNIALAVSLALAAAPAFAQSAPASRLPATQPGLTRDEGVFLITAADDGSRAAYFIAQNTRHSIASSDLQLEQQLNPLWPVRSVSREEVLAFPEAAPIGPAKTGLITAPVEPTEDATAAMDEPSPAANEAPSPVAEEAPSPAAEEAPSPAAEEPSPVVAAAPAPVVEDMPAPMANMPSSSPMPHAPLVAPKPADLQPLTPQAPTDLQPTNDEPTTYVVQTGDNLTRLSARFGTTIPAILSANKIASPNLVFVGQSLIIPAAAPKPDVVESPTTPAPTADAAPENVADAPNAEVAATYTVKAGDSAITIARQLGVNVDELLTANGVVNRNRVYVGQVLMVPEGRS